MTRITWLLPVRNGMPYLPDTLKSIADQTYRDSQILAWDNGSTDGTLEELQKWIPSRIPGKIVSDRPLKLGVCLATMVQECETELCARIDADDINYPERLAKQLAFMDANPDVAAIGAWTHHINSRGEDLGLKYKPPGDHFSILAYMIHENPLAHPSVMFRRDAIISVGNYANVTVEDYELWQRVAKRYRLGNITEPLISYRIHAKSLVGKFLAAGQYQRTVAQDCAPSASKLYGPSAHDMQLLREHRHPFALAPLSRIARTLEPLRTDPNSSAMRSPVFLSAAQDILAPWDPLSSVMLGALDPRVGWKGGLKRAAVRMLTAAWSKFPRLHSWLAIYRFWKWRKDLAAQSTVISPTIHIDAVKNAYNRINIGSESYLERDMTIWISDDEGAQAQLDLGNHVYIGRNTFLGAYQPISIGANTLIGAYSYIISANHRFDRRDIPIRSQGYTGAPIVIEEDVWIGTHVTVLPGVKIGRGAIIGAGSMVNKNIPPYEIWGGIPARFIKARPDETQ